MIGDDVTGAPHLLWLAGIVILGLAIAFGLWWSRRTSGARRAQADQGARAVYEAEHRDPANR
jgi:hypothetical protein